MITMHERESKKVALVTGCGKETGIGASIAHALSQSMIVVASDVAPSGVANIIDAPTSGEWHGLPSLVAAIEASGGVASSVTGDVSSEAEAQAMVDQVIQRYGRLDVLVNNAAAPMGREFGDIADVTLGAWESIMAINLRGTFLMTRAAVKPMRQKSWGRIINISSSNGRTGYARQAAYSASKAGIIGLTRSVAHDVARQGITVNAICPGWVKTSRSYNSAHRIAGDVEAELTRRAERVPVGRLGAPADVACMVAFLATDQASYLTGQTFDVDGGLLMA